MAEAALKGVLGSLSSIIEKEVGLLLGFDQDYKRLASLLTTVMATLEDAEEKQFSNKSIKDWLQKLKLAAYELEDIMDECAYEELRLEYEEVKCCLSEMVLSSSLSSFHPMHLVSRYKIAKRMKRISERLKEIAEERTNFHLIETAPERSRVNEWRQTSSTITEPQVYGREQDKDNIVDFLVGGASHSEDLSVYPIVGLGGLGKTTLAQLIFSHERVVKHFELRIWVCVSEDFSLKRTTKAIIEAASGHACEDLDLEPLQNKLRDLLERKRYLLVLDDVWDDEHEKWQRLKSVLACGGKGASILVTTRLAKVASIMGTMPPHELSVLSKNDCWELFKHRAFGPNEVERVEFVVIGKEIVKKCGGVPLAAKAVGALLRFKREEREWLLVKDSNLWSLPQSENSIMPALRLSYLNLPMKLKECFAYCAIFPKDEKIEKKYLIDLWVANGFITSDEVLDAEVIGDGVWHELYWRSFFQDINRDESGSVTSFKMHDLVHDLAQFVAEEVFCFTDNNGVTTLSERILHLSNYGSAESALNQLHQVKSLRTYLDQREHDGELSLNVLKCFPLRVLELRRVRSELSSSIGHLKHLRYLNLSGGMFKTLPESLCELWNLQILKLDRCEELQKLPNNLIRLKFLQQLSLSHCDSLSSLPNNLITLKFLQQLSLYGCLSLSSLPPYIGKLSSLRSLSMYLVGKEKGFLLAELGSLKLKGLLHIKHLGKVKSVKDARDANMSIKQLNELRLSWYGDEDSELQENVEEIFEVFQPGTQQLKSLHVEGYKGVHFPQWMSSPSLKYLTTLRLLECKSCLKLPALGKLPCLKELFIQEASNVKYISEELYDSGAVFMALEWLTLSMLPNLIRLSREDGKNIFPRLSKLRIENCPKFLAEEELLQGLHTLTNLYISGCDKLNVSPGFQCLTRLEILHIGECREVEGLHEALQHMSALKNLSLKDLPNLESLPDTFGNLSLLRRLAVVDCPKLKSLPTSLSLSSMEQLMIQGCTELKKRCEKETGEDWLKIAHIPHILLEDASAWFFKSALIFAAAVRD